MFEDEILESIKNHAVNSLREEKRYCGVSYCDGKAIMTSECNSGYEIKITIELKPV